MSKIKRLSNNIPNVPLALSVDDTNKALFNIEKLRDRYIGHMLSWDKDPMWVLSRLFPASVIEGCLKGYELCCDSNRLGSAEYKIFNYPGLGMVTFRIDYGQELKLKILSPRE